MMAMPQIPNSTNVQTRYPNALLELVNQFRRAQPGGKTLSRSHCLRILVERGLSSAGYMKQKRPGRKGDGSVNREDRIIEKLR
jgi:hypothetical protein